MLSKRDDLRRRFIFFGCMILVCVQYILDSNVDSTDQETCTGLINTFNASYQPMHTTHI